jgi:hypothetical protein
LQSLGPNSWSQQGQLTPSIDSYLLLSPVGKVGRIFISVAGYTVWDSLSFLLGKSVCKIDVYWDMSLLMDILMRL